MLGTNIRAAPILTAVALVLLGSSRASFAQGSWSCPRQEGLAAWVDGRRIPLSQDRTDRLPYGKDITILLRTGTPAPHAVRVLYDLEGGADGPRLGTQDAVASPQDPTCWAAAVPKLRLNESGRYEAQLLRPAQFAAGRNAATFAADYILGLAGMPVQLAPAQFVEQVGIVGQRVVSQAFVDDPSVLVVRVELQPTPLLDHLASLLTASLETANILNNAQSDARELAQRIDALGALDASLLNAGILSCRAGETVARLRSTAAAIAGAELPELARMVARGELPWPECALAVLAAAEPPNPRARQLHGDAVRLTRRLVEDPALHTLLGVARRVEALATVATTVRTIEVPVGADLLERYTQLDVVMAYLPNSAYGLVQPFAAATWYLASPGASNEFAASVQPRGADRWGIQIGYPVGGPVQASTTRFEPTLLAGIIVRINAVNSISAGDVIGRVVNGDRQRTHHVFFISTNLDVSNLGPLQQLFARRDR